MSTLMKWMSEQNIYHGHKNTVEFTCGKLSEIAVAENVRARVHVLGFLTKPILCPLPQTKTLHKHLYPNHHYPNCNPGERYFKNTQ